MRFTFLQARRKRALFKALTLICLIAALLWPAIWNRGPFYFTDTRTYMRGADAAINKFTHITTEWTALDADFHGTDSGSASKIDDQRLHNLAVARTRSLTEIKKKGVMLGRSLLYGFLLYIGAITGGFWLTMVIQSALVLFILYLVLRALSYPVWPTLAWICLGLCLISDLPFFASFLLPDLFAGFAILSCAVLTATRKRFTPAEDALWYLVLTASILCHDSCLLISVSLLALAVVADLFLRSWTNKRGLFLIVLAILTSCTSQSLVTYGITRIAGEKPLRFPLIEARLIEDGPGTNYLRATCPESHFTLCEYVNQFPLTTNTFLFGTEPGRSVYEMASYEKRSALSAEQFRFLLAVLRYDPVGVVKAGLRNFTAQLLDFKLSNFRYGQNIKAGMARTFPLQVVAQMSAEAAYQGTMPVETLTAIEYILVLVCVIYLLLVFSKLAPGRNSGDQLKGIFCWALAGILLNAAICGGISEDESRYQARVIWLIPLIALLAEAPVWIRPARRRNCSESLALPAE
jgi:hypothetical protein